MSSCNSHDGHHDEDEDADDGHHDRDEDAGDGHRDKDGDKEDADDGQREDEDDGDYDDAHDVQSENINGHLFSYNYHEAHQGDLQQPLKFVLLCFVNTSVHFEQEMAVENFKE